MNSFSMNSNNESMQWLIFVAILLAIGFGITCFIVWLFVLRKSGNKRPRRRKQRRHHHINPTLAQTGGLPPKRKPGEPPPGL